MAELLDTQARPVSFTQFGAQFDGNVDIHNAFIEAGLDFQVKSQPIVRAPMELITPILNGSFDGLYDGSISDEALLKAKTSELVDWTLQFQRSMDLVSGYKATYRDDNGRTFAPVGEGYEIVQNEEALSFIDFLSEVSGENAKIVSAGALGYGERIFVTVQLGDDIYIDPKDAHKTYVVFTTSHDGSGSVAALITHIRVVCQNTLNAALRDSETNRMTFKHTANVGKKLDWQVEENRKRAAKIFGKVGKFNGDFIANMLNLKGQNVDDKYVREFIAKMYLDKAQMALLQKANWNYDKVDEISTRKKNLIDALTTAIESGIGQHMYRGTKLWLLNGWTTFLHNAKTYKSAEAEFTSLYEGSGKNGTQKAYDLLIAA